MGRGARTASRAAQPRGYQTGAVIAAQHLRGDERSSAGAVAAHAVAQTQQRTDQLWRLLRELHLLSSQLGEARMMPPCATGGQGSNLLAEALALCRGNPCRTPGWSGRRSARAVTGHNVARQAASGHSAVPMARFPGRSLVACLAKHASSGRPVWSGYQPSASSKPALGPVSRLRRKNRLPDRDRAK